MSKEARVTINGNNRVTIVLDDDHTIEIIDGGVFIFTQYKDDTCPEAFDAWDIWRLASEQTVTLTPCEKDKENPFE